MNYIGKSYARNLKSISRKSLFRFFLLALASAENIGNNTSTIEEIKKKKYKILLIDDEDSFRHTFSSILKTKYKTRVIDVDSGKKGIEELKNGKKFDFIFIDLFMPNMMGIDTFHEVKKIDPEVRVIIMSVRPGTKEWTEAQKVPGVILIDKTQNPENILIEISLNDKKYDQKKNPYDRGQRPVS